MIFHSIKKVFVMVGLTFITTVLFAQQKNNLLTNNYSRGFVNQSLIKDKSWIKYPSYVDRNGWSQLTEGFEKKDNRRRLKWVVRNIEEEYEVVKAAYKNKNATENFSMFQGKTLEQPFYLFKEG